MATEDSNFQILAGLTKHGVSLLKLSFDTWNDIISKKNQGKRFSLNFPHESASKVRKRTLALISVEGRKSQLLAGLVGHVSATSTLDTRIVFDFVCDLKPNSLSNALNLITQKSLKAGLVRLKKNGAPLLTLTPKLGEGLAAALLANPHNFAVLSFIHTHMSPPKHFLDARAMQWDALKIALKAFGADEASMLSLADPDTALSATRLHEDAVIEHDARWIPGWTLSASNVTGTATFQKDGEKLEVITANKRPLEMLFGVDLIYFNKSRGSLIMVQYKMMERQQRLFKRKTLDGNEELIGRTDYSVSIDAQFKSEIKRMKKFDRDVDKSGPYRLNSGAFYIKLVKRSGNLDGSGIILSLNHLTDLISKQKLRGPRGGFRINYEELDGHYLRSTSLIELIRSGYIGTRGSTTDTLLEFVQAGLDGGRAVVAAIHTILPHRQIVDQSEIDLASSAAF